LKRLWSYFIGDIHGCLEEFLNLEEKIKNHAKKNRVRPFIISVGDLIDRGPDSKGVVQHFIKGRKEGTHDAILGNHEAFLLCTLQCFAPSFSRAFQKKFPLWLYTFKQRFEEGELSQKMSWEEYSMTLRTLWTGQGGRETLISYGLDPENPDSWFLPKDHMNFYLSLRPFLETKKAIVTHGLPLQDSLSSVRSFFDTKKRASSDVKESVYSLLWNRLLPGVTKIPGKTLVSGHTPLSHIKRHRKEGALQIDTGCYAGQRLSAWCSEKDNIIFVRAKKKYF
jgi:diadenosine tetraphosphatase ApaH/serine/threonine PP2A family protein phosphatase